MTDIGGLQPSAAETQAPLFQGSGRSAIGTAIANIPALIQNAQQRQQLQQLQVLQIKQQKLQLGQQMYGQLYDEIGNDPLKLGDVASIKRVQDIAKQTGVPPAIKVEEHGNTIIDTNMLMPKPDVARMDPQKKFDLYKEIVARFAAGKLTPQEYVAEVQTAHELVPTVNVDALLTPDVIQSGTSTWANEQLDWLRTRGIVLKDDAKTRQKMEQDRAAEAIATIGLRGEALRIKQQEFQATQDRLWKTHLDNLAVAQSRLSNQFTALQSLMGQRAFMQQLQTSAALQTGPLRDLRTQFDAANAQLTGVTKAMQSAANSGQAVTPELQGQYDSLTQLVGQIKPQLDLYERYARSHTNSAQSGVAGKPVATVPGSTPQIKSNAPVKTGTSKSGKAIYSTDGGTTWFYGTGPK